MEPIQIRDYGHYNEEEILALYEGAGWHNYTKNPQMLRDAYEHSLCILGAYAGDSLVGILRMVGDGHSIIYIQDIIVAPALQRQGIGSRLLTQALERYTHVYQKVLLTDNTEKTVRFYEKLGFATAQAYGCACFVRYTV